MVETKLKFDMDTIRSNAERLMFEAYQDAENGKQPRHPQLWTLIQNQHDEATKFVKSLAAKEAEKGGRPCSEDEIKHRAWIEARRRATETLSTKAVSAVDAEALDLKGGTSVLGQLFNASQSMMGGNSRTILDSALGLVGNFSDWLMKVGKVLITYINDNKEKRSFTQIWNEVGQEQRLRKETSGLGFGDSDSQKALLADLTAPITEEGKLAIAEQRMREKGIAEALAAKAEDELKKKAELLAETEKKAQEAKLKTQQAEADKALADAEAAKLNTAKLALEIEALQKSLGKATHVGPNGVPPKGAPKTSPTETAKATGATPGG